MVMKNVTAKVTYPKLALAIKHAFPGTDICIKKEAAEILLAEVKRLTAENQKVQAAYDELSNACQGAAFWKDADREGQIYELTEQNERLTAERDAMRNCQNCINLGTRKKDAPCKNCGKYSNWQWRGAQVKEAAP
jgi:hypothetical protein